MAGRFLEHYATLRGAVRQTLVSRQLDEHLEAPPGRVCDVGGGAGHQAIPLARRGYEVTVLDPSEEMLQRAREMLSAEDQEIRGRVRFVSGAGEDAPRIFARGSFDAVLCHGVLLYLEDARPLVGAVAEVVRPGGVVSILTKNADALAMRPGLEGRYGDALAAFDRDRDLGRNGVVTRGDTVSGLSKMLKEHAIAPVRWYGVRVFTDQLRDRRPGLDLPEILEVEWEAGRRDPYRGVARMIHLIGRKLTAGGPAR